MKRVPKLGHEKWETVRIYAEDEVLAGIQDAQRKLAAENPDRVVTVGGNCMVSPALLPAREIRERWNCLDLCASGCIHAE